ncbi:hypothetical protein BDY21DRAFT_360357 [Lineolata rhizophorae]|uniref:Uncharacterized protein n=1 Tax=Lineolata rhizophorae TaxID=578093 RepID=A0A6A6PEN5_9PEZI|nr:hypothetical protein BDY21DRAFT_360357 [Lineolata rhizophorae]
MAAFLAFLKTVTIPALISLALYLLLTHILIPLLRRHRARYSQYLPLAPLSLRSPPAPSSTLRTRLSSALLSFLFPRALRARLFPSSFPSPSALSPSPRHRSRSRRAARPDDDDERDDLLDDSDASPLFDDEEGEGMVGFDMDERRRRREALERRRGGGGAAAAAVRGEDPASWRRLSRDLEEGFRDDSSGEEGEGDGEGDGGDERAAQLRRNSLSR